MRLKNWGWIPDVMFLYHLVKPALGPTQHPIQCFRVSVPGDEVAEGLS